MNRSLFATVAFALPLFALAGCKKAEAPAPAATETVAVETSAAPQNKPGITVGSGKLVLPAVAGNPGAAYFSLRNAGTEAATIAAVSVTGAARSEMHETKGSSMTPIATLEIKPGEIVNFAKGGKHVMAFEIDQALAAGGSTELTLTFSDGDKASTTLSVGAAN